MRFPTGMFMSLYLREEFWYWLYYRFFFVLLPLAISLSYMALLESLVKSPVMNNRCLICAIVVALSPRSKDLVLSIVMVFQPPFVLFGGILFRIFLSKKNIGLKPFSIFLLRMGQLKRIEIITIRLFFFLDTIPFRQTSSKP
jgi:hypothetical protein